MSATRNTQAVVAASSSSPSGGLPPRSPNASGLLASLAAGGGGGADFSSPPAGHLSFNAGHLGAGGSMIMFHSATANQGNPSNNSASNNSIYGGQSTAVTQHIRALRRIILRAATEVGRLAGGGLLQSQSNGGAANAGGHVGPPLFIPGANSSNAASSLPQQPEVGENGQNKLLPDSPPPMLPSRPSIDDASANEFLPPHVAVVGATTTDGGHATPSPASGGGTNAPVSPAHSLLRMPPSPVGLASRTVSQTKASLPSNQSPSSNSFLAHMLGRSESDVVWRKTWIRTAFFLGGGGGGGGSGPVPSSSSAAPQPAREAAATPAATVTIPSHHETQDLLASETNAKLIPDDAPIGPHHVVASAPSGGGPAAHQHNGEHRRSSTAVPPTHVVVDDTASITPPPNEVTNNGSPAAGVSAGASSSSNSGHVRNSGLLAEGPGHSLGERPPLGPSASFTRMHSPLLMSPGGPHHMSNLSRDAILVLLDALGQVYHGLDRLPQLLAARRSIHMARRSIAGANASGSAHPLTQYTVPWGGDASAIQSVPSMSFMAGGMSIAGRSAADGSPDTPIKTTPGATALVGTGVATTTGAATSTKGISNANNIARGVSFINVSGNDGTASSDHAPMNLSSTSVLPQPPDPSASQNASSGGARYRNQHHLHVNGSADRRESVASIVAHPDLVETTRNYDEEGAGGTGLDQSGDQERINQYVLLSVIGQGAQGEVYMAYDTITDEVRAIKCIPRPPYWTLGESNAGSPITSPSKATAAANTPGVLVPHPPQSATTAAAPKPTRAQRKAAQLSREIAIMKRCRHQHVVALYEVIDDPKAGKVYLVMQYIEHGPLLQLNDDGTSDIVFTPDEVAAYGRQICAGLCYLHEHNVVHRDIKPDNILLGDDNVVYLADFGVSELFAEDADFSIRGKRGTKAFLAPEIVATEKDGVVADGKLVDVWALGLTFYLMLEGYLPWRFSTPQQYFEDTMHKPVAFSSAVPDKWRVIIRGMLAVDPKQRWSSERARAEVKALHRELSDLSAAAEVADAELSSAITRR